MFVTVEDDRFYDIESMLKFENPEVEKQSRLLNSGIIKRASPVEAYIYMYSRLGRNAVEVPMGAGWSADECYEDPAEVMEYSFLMDHQRVAARDLLKWRSGMVVAPCGGGKTQIGIAIHKFLSSRPRVDGVSGIVNNRATLVLVHSKDLANQWAERASRLLDGTYRPALGSEAFSVACNKMMWKSHDLVITTVQTINAWIKAQSNDSSSRKTIPWAFQAVILDEAHHAPASTFQAVLSRLACNRVYGLTATPDRDDGWTPAMYAWLGPCRHRIESSHLQRVGLTIAPRVIEVETGYYAWTGDFNLIVEGIVNSRARNEIIRRMVHTHGRYPQLILTSRVSHAQLLAQMIPDSEVVVGSTKKRDEVFQSVRDGKTKVLIATQLADEGLDLPSLTAVHMTTPSRSSGRVVQRVGRVMRMAPGKQEAVVYDYCDDMGVLQSQRRARFAAYRSEISGVKFSRTDMSHVMHEQL